MIASGCTAISATLCLPAIAQEAAPANGPATLSLVVENDFFGGADQGYTNGIKVAYMSPEGRGRMRLTYTHTFRTREYKGQDDRLDFGALTLSAAL